MNEKNLVQSEKRAESSNFIHDIIDSAIASNPNQIVQTRFPPEPNGYLHIGHAKAICIDFGTAEKYHGKCNLRLDDTNPSKEETEYADAIQEDIKWLGFDWEDRMYYASDYFEKLYQFALVLVKKGAAYVDDLSAAEIREYRGTLTESGKESPYRNRTIEENYDLFQRMKDGEFPDGSKVLRAKIDMSSPNMNMRDPVVYRIMRAHHHRTGDKWCIYPMYDFAHPLSDAIEGITFSLCSLEFEDHRPLYDWFVNQVGFDNPPRQIEFARLNVTNTITSKRKCIKLVEDKIVNGWDDPRMSTLCGMRRRGYPANAIKDFCERVGVAKSLSTVDFALLEHCVRENLNENAPRAMAVLRPLKLIIDNYPQDKTEQIDFEINPNSNDTRSVEFCGELYIERDDFMEEAPKKYFRLSVGREVRLKNAYYVTCTHIVKDAEGEVVEVHAVYDPDTRGGSSPDHRKVKGTIHWVSARHCEEAEVRLYEPLFFDSEAEQPEINNNSLKVITAKIEPFLKGAGVGETFQFLRNGYFCVDPDTIAQAPQDYRGGQKDENPQQVQCADKDCACVASQNKIVFNQTVALKDSWVKISK